MEINPSTVKVINTLPANTSFDLISSRVEMLTRSEHMDEVQHDPEPETRVESPSPRMCVVVTLCWTRLRVIHFTFIYLVFNSVISDMYIYFLFSVLNFDFFIVHPLW